MQQLFVKHHIIVIDSFPISHRQHSHYLVWLILPFLSSSSLHNCISEFNACDRWCARIHWSKLLTQKFETYFWSACTCMLYFSTLFILSPNKLITYVLLLIYTQNNIQFNVTTMLTDFPHIFFVSFLSQKAICKGAFTNT